MSCLFSLGLFFCFGIAVVTSCRQDWVQFEGSCYGFGELQVSWEDAQDFCISVGARLVEIETSGENEFLKTELRKKLGAFWAGASDVFHEGTWLWMSSGALLTSFSDWVPGMPGDSQAGQDCLFMQKMYDYQWNDGQCQNLKKFICETSADGAVIG